MIKMLIKKDVYTKMNNGRRKRLRKLLNMYENLLLQNSLLDIKQEIKKTYSELSDIKLEEEISYDNRSEGSQCSESGGFSEMCIENMEEAIDIIDNVLNCDSLGKLRENEYIEDIIYYINECI